VCGYLKDFLFDPKQARDAVSTLSGGQQNRLMLAKVLANPEVMQRFAAVETDPLQIGVPAFNELLRKEEEVWSPLVRQLGLKQE
jgi:tripartite-type tricarboxylate transporter receptor subunit TctC